MKCSNCQEEIEEKHRRCPNCGAPNTGFKKEDEKVLKTRIDALEAEIETLKKNNKKTAASDVL